jgi:predicted glycogen debranching enzyme
LRRASVSAIKRAMRELRQEPTTGESLVRFVGDSVHFTLRDASGQDWPPGWRAFLRTNLGRASAAREETLAAVESQRLPALSSWHDIPLHRHGNVWSAQLPLIEVGFFRAKAYATDPRGWQHWPAGPDVGLNVQPNACRTANTIYCAFPRMFGPTKPATATTNDAVERSLKKLDAQGYTVIPPSGTLRDLVKELPHILGTLGCRILHLLPVNPVPTTYARFGRFGSPYAAGDLLAIDPALIEFDRRTTGVQQFRELTRAVHARGGWVFLDLAINHTAWESSLHWQHPEWFLRQPDGAFASPGAWGTTWEDLVELEHDNPDLRRYLAEVFLEWCRRGVDGFRCDAGYMVPLPVWQYITARVRREFPDTVFLLEGLGGAWETTAAMLTEGGLQWAYSELFQNLDGAQVASYLDHALSQGQRTGLLVHYSETHDNNRLAAQGRAWSLLRNRLCALASVSGGYGFTCGVEWLATEKVNVHASRGLAWGNATNIVPELARLNRLLAEHPCFFDGARLTRLSAPTSPVYALRRTSAEGSDAVLVLVNTDAASEQKLMLAAAALEPAGFAVDLLGQTPPDARTDAGQVSFLLPPGAAYCLAATAKLSGTGGVAYRQRRAAEALALTVLAHHLPAELIGAVDQTRLAEQVEHDLPGFLSAATYLAEALERARTIPANQPADLSADSDQPDFLMGLLASVRGTFPRVVTWQCADRRRVTPVPPDHWLLIEDSVLFQATIVTETGRSPWHGSSIGLGGRQVACCPPPQRAGKARLRLERYGAAEPEVHAPLLFLEPAPTLRPIQVRHPEQRLVLLTNGRGGMARLRVDFGAIRSKYDCLLAANLNPTVPEDRHVFAKRVRVWANADGFITPLNAQVLLEFAAGPPARWVFSAPAGDARQVEIELLVGMVPDRNTTALRFRRPSAGLGVVMTESGTAIVPGAKEAPTKVEPAGLKVSGGPPAIHDVTLTVRVDVEDRNFHAETKRNGGAEGHFTAHTRAIPSQDKPPPAEATAKGFVFAPAPDRQLRVWTMTKLQSVGPAPATPRNEAGRPPLAYHPQPEWSEQIAHPVEASRGLVGSGDAFSPGWFELALPEQAQVTVIVCAEPTEPDADQIERAFSPAPVHRPRGDEPVPDAFTTALDQAASAFLVRRDQVRTVIAGYPWFLDWGRDTLVATRGLIAAGWLEEVGQLLALFGRWEKDGTLPNTLQGAGVGNRDTSDAPLWYGLACEELAAAELRLAALSGATPASARPTVYARSVDAAGRTIADVLSSIAASYLRGTPNGIRLDPASALIYSPSHFTWMDTNFPAGTPREGYPIEVQALWVRLLRQLDALNLPPVSAPWSALAQRAQESIQQRFWLESHGWFADVLRARRGEPASTATPDDALRGNCLYVVALGLASGEPARRCVAAALRHLVVPGAVRSLAPLPVQLPLPIHAGNGHLLNDPQHPYWGRYEGDEDTRRKPAYHNGTAWVWTLPTFCEALARAWDFSPPAVAAARAYLGTLLDLWNEGCFAQLPEILDGDAPHEPRGCDAQAWSVTEAQRVWRLLRQT